jgi:glycerol-3-phosphate cytidylyltransferase-like family protein
MARRKEEHDYNFDHPDMDEFDAHHVVHGDLWTKEDDQAYREYMNNKTNKSHFLGREFISN